MVAEKILIVEHSLIEGRNWANLFTTAGYAPTVVPSGDDVFRAVRDQQIDLVLLNVTSPTMDAYQVCRLLKSSPETRDRTVVIYAMHDESINGLKGLEAGVDDFVTKIATRDDLLHRVKDILIEQQKRFSSDEESLGLTLTQLMAQSQDRREPVDWYFGAFKKHARESMNLTLSAYVAGTAISRVVEKTTVRFPFFSGLFRAYTLGLLFDSSAIDDVSAQDLVVVLQTFHHETYGLTHKLIRTYLNPLRDARVIDKAFSELIKEVQTKYHELEDRADHSVPVARPVEMPAQPLRLECTFDADGNIVSCHDDMTRAIGYDKTELLGRSFSHLLAPEHRQALDRAFDQIVEKGSAHITLQLQRKDGVLVYTEARLKALYDAEGHFQLTRGVLQVIPAASLIRQRDEENEKLKRSLRDLHQEFDLLTSTISNNLQQPIRAILMLCEFLEAESIDQPNAPHRDYIHSIKKAGVTLRELIEDILNYSRAPHSSGASESVNLNQLIEQVRQTLSPTLTGRHAGWNVTGALPVIAGHREQLKMLFTELATNAVKFNESAHPVVEIGVTDGEPDACTFYVRDNGIGIEEKSYESIFDLFHRLHQPGEYEGTGAGLSICRRIVDSHGGRIWIESRPGVGSTFFFTLPQNPIK